MLVLPWYQLTLRSQDQELFEELAVLDAVSVVIRKLGVAQVALEALFLGTLDHLVVLSLFYLIIAEVNGLLVEDLREVLLHGFDCLHLCASEGSFLCLFYIDEPRAWLHTRTVQLLLRRMGPLIQLGHLLTLSLAVRLVYRADVDKEVIELFGGAIPTPMQRFVKTPLYLRLNLLDDVLHIVSLEVLVDDLVLERHLVINDWEIFVSARHIPLILSIILLATHLGP